MRLTHSSDEDDVMTDDEQQVFNSYPEDHNDCLDMPGVVSDEEDDDAPPAEDMKYIRYQEDFYFNSFSPEALRDSTDLRTFLDLIPQHTPEDVMMIKLIRFKRQAKLSRPETFIRC